MRRLVWILLLCVVGCGGTETLPIPPTEGDFVRNDNGVGTAVVFGISFRVDGDSSGASTEDSITANFVNVGESQAQKIFRIGDEIEVQLDSLSESEVEFRFNEQHFGRLSVGDEVVIGDDRKVEVNGIQRLPKDDGQGTIVRQ